MYINTRPDNTYTQVYEGMLQLIRKLIIWYGNDTTLIQSAIELDGIDTRSKYMKELGSEFEQEQVIDTTLSDFTEQITHGQSDCKLWQLLYNGRITSWMLGEIIRRPVSIQQRIIGYTPMMGLPAPSKWGREKEATALHFYTFTQ